MEVTSMLSLKDNTQIYLCLQPVDMRKSINGLSVAVIDILNQQSTSGHVFIFYNKLKDKVKILWWDTNGYIVCYKRLEKGRFKIPRDIENKSMSIEHKQLNWLLAGLDFDLMHQFSDLNYSDSY
jgi:transposase